MTSRAGLSASTIDTIRGPSPPAASGTGRPSPARAAAGWALLGGLALVVSIAPPARAGTTERVSVAAGGAQANGPSGVAVPDAPGSAVAISGDGRLVAFRSAATNLVPGDTNGKDDVFVRDRLKGATERVSVATGGAQGNGPSYQADISDDGRYVLFGSGASNLVPGDTNEAPDLFVRDRLGGTTERVSVASGGAEANFGASGGAISADGRVVAFYSEASTLVPGDTNEAPDVFVHDRETGATERVDVSSGGAQADGESGGPVAVSADGRYVAFGSFATNLAPGAPGNGYQSVFVRDRQAGTTRLVSVGLNGAPASSASGGPSISADGRRVAFCSLASNLVPGDTNRKADVFVRDLPAGATRRVSVRSGGGQVGAASCSPSISADGRVVAFTSKAASLVPGDTNRRPDLFVRDLAAGTTERVDVSSGGAQADGPGSFPVISADGRVVGFASAATDLVPGDTNGAMDVFVRVR